MSRRALLEIPNVILADILACRNPPGRLVEDLPRDLKVLRAVCGSTMRDDVTVFVVESESFGEVAEGYLLPYFRPTYTWELQP
jgi:hypothetical protein